MYAGRVCCPLVRHVEYAPRALIRLGKRRDTLIYVRKRWHIQTDGLTPDRYITLTARREQRSKLRLVGPVGPCLLFKRLTNR